MGSEKRGIIRKSISAKLNIMIVLIILIVAGLLMIISNRAYRRAVFESVEKKLNGVELQGSEETLPILDHMLQVFETDEFREARQKYGPDVRNEEGMIAIAAWMSSQPGAGQPDSREEIYTSLLADYITAGQWVEAVWSANGLYCLQLEVANSEKTWHIYDLTLNVDSTVFVDLNFFGQEGGSYPELAAANCESAVQAQVGERNLCIRCLQGALESGGSYRVWVSFDMTDAVAEYHGFLVTSLLAVLGLTLLSTGIALLILRRQVSRPIVSMARATRAFLPGEDGTYSADSVSPVEIRSRDELGDLSRDIRSMQQQIVENTGNLARMTAERERIATEMNLARNIQASALPGRFPAFPDRREFDLYASMTPAREVGGDFYDFFLVDDDHLALVIADVSDKGIPAALFMMTAKSLIRDQLMAGRDPAAALERVNAQLAEGNTSAMFVTVWLAVLEISTGRGLACNAGHENPALRRAGGNFELLEYKHNRFVGLWKKASYQNRPFELHPGDCVFVYTDGVPEAGNPAGELFGDERLAEALNRCPDAGPETLVRRVGEAVESFAEGAEQSDDITMLCLEYAGPRT